MAWHPLAIPGFVALVAAAGMSALLYKAHPARMQNRILALAVAFDGLAMGSFGVSALCQDAGTCWGALATNRVAAAALAFVYLAFLGTLDSPLTRPFRGPRARAALLGFSLVPLVAYPLARGVVMQFRPFDVVLLSLSAVLYFGLAAAVSMFLRTPRGTPARRRAGVFLVAFGARDLIAGSLLLASQLVDPAAWPYWLGFVAYPTATLLFVLLTGYGILREHLFDIDLRIKWTIRQGTLGAAFIGMFFVVSEAAQEYFGTSLGSVYMGILAAGLLVFALAPLQRLADRISDTAMPGVRDTAEYRTVRKREVYRAAVESALQDGVVTERERDVLATLADQLGIGAREAVEIEREATRSLAPASAR